MCCMVDEEEQQINDMTRAIQQALLPILAGARAEIAMPAILQVVMTMAMFTLDCGPTDAIDSIIETLEDTKRSRAN